MRITQTQSGIVATLLCISNPLLAALVCRFTYNYPIIILNADISSYANKVMQHYDTATFSCQVQGSHLMEKKKNTKVKKKDFIHVPCTKPLGRKSSETYKKPSVICVSCNFPVTISHYLFSTHSSTLLFTVRQRN